MSQMVFACFCWLRLDSSCFLKDKMGQTSARLEGMLSVVIETPLSELSANMNEVGVWSLAAGMQACRSSIQTFLLHG